MSYTDSRTTVPAHTVKPGETILTYSGRRRAARAERITRVIDIDGMVLITTTTGTLRLPRAAMVDVRST